MYIDKNCNPECLGCLQQDNKLTDVKYWLKPLVEQLYASADFDADEFERCLEELCHVVKMKVPKEPLNVERRVPVSEIAASSSSDKVIDIQSWINWNKHFLQSLVN